FEVVGDSLRLFLGGTLVAFAGDGSLTTGTVGLRSNGAGVSYDNFSSDLLTPPVVTLPFGPDAFTGTSNNLLSNNWQEHAGNFVDSTSGGNANSAVANSALNDAMLNGVSQTDVFVQADITLSAVGQYAGLAARYTGPVDSNMYWGAIGKTG